MSAAEMNCPECGSTNKAGAKTCDMCGAPLIENWREKPRLRDKILRRTDFMAAARANRKATSQLIIFLLLVLASLGYLLGWSLQTLTGAWPLDAESAWFLSAWGIKAALVLLIIGAAWSWVAFKKGDRIVLRMTGARQVSENEERQLHNVVEEMAIAAGIVKPRVYVIETDALNAFATGMHPGNSAIGVTRGLLDTLNREELQGVIGHEMGHIVNWDIRYATAVGIIVGLIALVSDAALRSLRFSGRTRGSGSGRSGGAGVIVVLVFLMVFAALAPLFSRLVQMAVSRQREFLADATSVRLTRSPEGLLSALDKLASSAKPFKGANRATQHMFIVNPFRNFSKKTHRLMATHPPLEVRMFRLRNLGE